MPVNFHFEKLITLKHRTRLKEILALLFKKEGRGFDDLTYIFCSDEYLLEINNKFLKHDFYTDIITFDLAGSKKDPAVGEIYISVDRVRENAKEFNSSVENELRRVIFHGALHLCGYKDKSEAQKMAMTQKEDYYLKKNIGPK